MEILGIGPFEALLIVLIALIAVGPRDIGKAARSLGRFLNRLYRSEAWHNLTQASRNLRSLPNRLAREAALEELDQVRQDIREGIPSPAVPAPAAISPNPTKGDSGPKRSAPAPLSKAKLPRLHRSDGSRPKAKTVKRAGGKKAPSARKQPEAGTRRGRKA